jgi:hypothetical protein
MGALIAAKCTLLDSSAAEALRSVKYGKVDTLGLDSVTETTICGRISSYDRHALIITEERDVKAKENWPNDSDPARQPLLFFSDPTDRSSPLQKFIEAIAKDDPTAKVGDLMERCDSQKIWEHMFEAPVSITGPTTSITCVRKGEILFTSILNLITNVMVVASELGVYRYDLSRNCKPGKEITLDHIIAKGKQIVFPGIGDRGFSLDDCRRFVTFLGKSGYTENFNDSGLFEGSAESFQHHTCPPGPPRPLYLSDLQKSHGQVGFILANGEKIGEWMPWLAFVKHARNTRGERALRAFEIWTDRPHMKNEMLMSTSPAYSIFCGEDDRPFLDISRLRVHEKPSQFRCMLAIVLADNERVTNTLEEHQYREVTNSF